MEFPALKNDRILRAARGEAVDKIPVWVMRQAGRYLPEFREVRSRHDFFQICRNPELACEITLQPIERFDLDAAIIFSDILVIPQAMGLPVEMRPGIGPVLPKPLVTPNDIPNLIIPNVQTDLKYVFDAITLTRKSLNGKVPLIGFTGAPWTLFAYMVEGGPSKTLSKAKSWLYKYPEESKKVLNMIKNVVVEYLVEQVIAGAQVFESNAEYLGLDMFKQFSLPYLNEICKSVNTLLKKRNVECVPMTIFAKGGHYALQELSKSGYDVVSIDWTIDPLVAREKLGPNITVQGNLDPCALYAPEEKLTEIVTEMINKFGKQKYICNLGHGIYPDMKPESVKHLVEIVHSF